MTKSFWLPPVPCCFGHLNETHSVRDCTRREGRCCSREKTDYPKKGFIGLSKSLWCLFYQPNALHLMFLVHPQIAQRNWARRTRSATATSATVTTLSVASEFEHAANRNALHRWHRVVPPLLTEFVRQRPHFCCVSVYNLLYIFK